jgi:inner membrane protein
VANSSPSSTARERLLITLAGVVPDIDGLGAIPDWLTRNSVYPLAWFSTYHHRLHNLALGLVAAGVSFALARHRWVTGLLALLSFHIHLLEDLLGGRGPDGYQWPIPYLTPFSKAIEFTWHGQWGLNAWPNFVITFGLLLAAFCLAWSRGYSPLEMLSVRSDKAFVAALRHRFPR